jgi:hypothetical protein
MSGELVEWLGEFLSTRQADSGAQLTFNSPGRYYAAAVMKVILGQIIMNYDCELANPEAPRWWTWRSSMLPKENTIVIFTPNARL